MMIKKTGRLNSCLFLFKEAITSYGGLIVFSVVMANTAIFVYAAIVYWHPMYTQALAIDDLIKRNEFVNNYPVPEPFGYIYELGKQICGLVLILLVWGKARITSHVGKLSLGVLILMAFSNVIYSIFIFDTLYFMLWALTVYLFYIIAFLWLLMNNI